MGLNISEIYYFIIPEIQTQWKCKAGFNGVMLPFSLSHWRFPTRCLQMLIGKHIQFYNYVLVGKRQETFPYFWTDLTCFLVLDGLTWIKWTSEPGTMPRIISCAHWFGIRIHWRNWNAFFYNFRASWISEGWIEL